MSNSNVRGKTSVRKNNSSIWTSRLLTYLLTFGAAAGPAVVRTGGGGALSVRSASPRRTASGNCCHQHACARPAICRHVDDGSHRVAGRTGRCGVARHEGGQCCGTGHRQGNHPRRRRGQHPLVTVIIEMKLFGTSDINVVTTECQLNFRIQNKNNNYSALCF